ncbi:MAG: serpin family protein [Prolixibacteraceae bacterium]|nr:serpin family protein [Prolixibacteraceae bacterium]
MKQINKKSCLVKIHIVLLAAILTALPLFSCNSDIDEPVEINLSQKSQQLVEADNEFGIDMFKLISEIEDGNYTISPLSVSLALAMTYNGARTETKAAMEEALRISGFTTEEINLAYQSLVKALLEADPLVTLEIAQSIWYREDRTVLDDFKEVNQTYYDAEVNALDFGRSDALDIINGWIEDKTHDKIQDMIKRIDPDHVMFLINAIYFNGEWKKKFDKKNTFEADFTKEDGTVMKVDMMSKSDSARVLYGDNFSAIELPYGRGNFNMVALVPSEGKTCDDILQEMTAEAWKNWMASMSKIHEINIWLPKFKAEYEIKLNDVLTAMGMGIAFEMGNADFSGINGGRDLYIDYVQHNTFIDVNEKGTEAAAATVVAMKEYAAMPMYFKVDKPFIYAITEKETGAILFIGKMMEPV